MPRRLLALAALLLIARPAAAAEADLIPSLADGKSLLKEGDALADKGDTTGAVLRYKKAFENLLPGMRKLPFKAEVKRDVTAREDLKGVLIKEIDEEMTPGEFRASELGMKAVGFLPREVDLKATMVRIYSEEIAAFYDTKTKTMHLIREPEAKKAPSFLERLMGRTGGFDKDENKTVIAHELTHALADQNYDIDALQKAVKDDDDRSLAFSALVEGEATLTMIGAQMSDWDGSKISAVPSADLDRALGFMGPMMRFAGGAGLRDAPPILVETLTFPYLRGLVFCARLTNDGGWPALNAAYASPPTSTEQILHPEKYSAQPDPPTTVDLGALSPGGDWKEVGRNTVGEMQAAVLLARQNGKVAAAGWDGDRYAVFERPGGALGLVWGSTWDTEADAREFAESYSRFQTRKLGPGIAEPDALPAALRRPHAGVVYAVERRGPDVAVVEGFNVDTTDALVEAAFRMKKAGAKARP